VLDPEDVNHVVRRYQKRIAKHGVTLASLKSGSIEKQSIRHHIHSLSLMGSCPTVLDIGCGLGGFYQYLKGHAQDCRYTGYDIVPKYIAECIKQYPEANFEVRNIFYEGIGGNFDTIIMSQVLNNRYRKSDNLQVMKKAITMAFQQSLVSVSLDMMSTYLDYQNPDLFYYPPEEIFRFAKSIARRVVLRHDYRPFEFCIQLFHENAAGYVP
jgi:SAM-dependent methyltransferase